eukprot:TRINITY_DN2348_c0_g1_i12.p1 TRINITY_DN2348_c0_g1~~TRINITY_DN2348_c0_g1_i12.p1  ORF type:complete len:179 (+),score=66.32 TRINITY_DN2348_c0_g1_i12:507-1043(+)
MGKSIREGVKEAADDPSISSEMRDRIHHAFLGKDQAGLDKGGYAPDVLVAAIYFSLFADDEPQHQNQHQNQHEQHQQHQNETQHPEEESEEEESQNSNEIQPEKKLFEKVLNRSLAFAGSSNYCPVLVGAILGAKMGADAIPSSTLKHVSSQLLERIGRVSEELVKTWKECEVKDETK